MRARRNFWMSLGYGDLQACDVLPVDLRSSIGGLPLDEDP